MNLNNYLTYLKSEGYPDNTIKAYRTDLTQMFNYIGKEDTDINSDDIVAWKGSMVCASATKNRKIMSAKAYFNYLAERHIIAVPPTKYVKGGKVKNKEKTPFTSVELRSMIQACTNQRNKALIMLLAATGMRISEVANLTHIKYINRQNNVITIIGKGNKERKIGLADEVCRYIDKYIDTERKGTTEYLFESNQGTILEESSINRMLKLMARKAGMDNWEEISPHWLRCTFATMQIDNGTPLEVVQKQLGHSNIQTTLIYAKIADHRATDAMTTLNF